MYVTPESKTYETTTMRIKYSNDGIIIAPNITPDNVAYNEIKTARAEIHAPIMFDIPVYVNMYGIVFLQDGSGDMCNIKNILNVLKQRYIIQSVNTFDVDDYNYNENTKLQINNALSHVEGT